MENVPSHQFVSISLQMEGEIFLAFLILGTMSINGVEGKFLIDVPIMWKYLLLDFVK